MDERTRRMIEAYLPHPRDPVLRRDEYYYQQETTAGPRVIRVFVLSILPQKDDIEFGVYQERGGRLVWIDSRGDGDHNRGVRLCELYDNKEDCRDRTHLGFDGWEDLRRLQEDAEGPTPRKEGDLK